MLDIWKQFNQNNIEFPFPQREVRILNEAQSPSDAAIMKAGAQAKGNTNTDLAMDSDGDD